MDSDESTTRSLTPRQAAAVPLMTAMDQSVVNTSRPLSPPSPELQSTAPGAETVHGDCAPSTYGCAGPERFVAATAGQASTADSPGSFDHRVREETILDQPRLLYTSPSYTGPSGWSHRSAYHALVQDKTNVQITTTASYMMRVLGLRVSLSKPDYSTHPRYDDVVITPLELRAIYMKALVWFIERECLDDGDCQIVFVGGVDTKSPDAAPAIPLNDLREMADQLPEVYRDAGSTDDFDAFMFHAGAFFVARRGWLSAVLVGLLIITAVVMFALVVQYLFPVALGHRTCIIEH